MPAPRVQCLNALARRKPMRIDVKAGFSTTCKALAERSESSALLEVIEDKPAFSKPTLPYRRIQLPGTSPNAGPSTNTVRTAANPNINANVLNILNARRSRPGSASNNSGGGMAETADEIAKHKMGHDLARHIYRRWKAGDVYAPHDLTGVEMSKWRRTGRPEQDVFDALDFNPIDEYKNFSIMSEYVTPMGRIMGSPVTGLRPVNQRRIARAIRRSIGQGLMPSVHRHPELLQREARRRLDPSKRNQAPR